jgi:hypothetical protein
MMNTSITRRLTTCIATAALMLAGGLSIAADEEPTGSITLHETEIALIIGGNWGHGTLTFDDEPHMFHMGGGKIGGLGMTVSDITGEVYGLTKLEDFSGMYFKAEAGATFVKGGTGNWVKNSKGVSIHMKAKSEGAALSIGVGGIKISLK